MSDLVGDPKARLSCDMAMCMLDKHILLTGAWLVVMLCYHYTISSYEVTIKEDMVMQLSFANLLKSVQTGLCLT